MEQIALCQQDPLQVTNRGWTYLTSNSGECVSACLMITSHMEPRSAPPAIAPPDASGITPWVARPHTIGAFAEIPKAIAPDSWHLSIKAVRDLRRT